MELVRQYRQSSVSQEYQGVLGSTMKVVDKVGNPLVSQEHQGFPLAS